MIGLWLEALSDVELRRVSDAPTLIYCNFYYDAAVCLVNASKGERTEGEDWKGRESCVATRFDNLGIRYPGTRVDFGLRTRHASRRVLAMIQNRARRILARRALSALPVESNTSTLVGAR